MKLHHCVYKDILVYIVYYHCINLYANKIIGVNYASTLVFIMYIIIYNYTVNGIIMAIAVLVPKGGNEIICMYIYTQKELYTRIEKRVIQLSWIKLIIIIIIYQFFFTATETVTITNYK